MRMDVVLEPPVKTGKVIWPDAIDALTVGVPEKIKSGMPNPIPAYKVNMYSCACSSTDPLGI